MSSSGTKVFIQIESETEQQEHLKQQRKTLKTIQGVANDKENLTGRQTALEKLSRLKANNTTALATSVEYGKRKRVETRAAETPLPIVVVKVDAETQTDDDTINNNDEAADKPITAEDLVCEGEPGENYYKRLAEKRRQALEHTLHENEHLNTRIEGLEEELRITQEELQEAQHLTEVLKEIIAEAEGNDDSDGEQETEVAQVDTAETTNSESNTSDDKYYIDETQKPTTSSAAAASKSPAAEKD